MTESALERAQDAEDMIDRMEPPEGVQNMLPKMLKMVPALMFIGLIIVVVAFAFSVVAADDLGTAIGEGPMGEGQEEFIDAQERMAWLPSLAFVGMATLLFGIIITLMAIAGALRTMGHNVVGLILEHEGR